MWKSIEANSKGANPMEYLYLFIEYQLRALVEGNLKLLQFYRKHFLKPFQQLPPELYDATAMRERLASNRTFELQVPIAYEREYTKDIKAVRAYIDDLSPPLEEPYLVGFHLKQILFFTIRFGTIIAAVYGDFSLAFLVSLLQFLVLPYSLFVALSYGVETVLVLYSGYVVIFPLLQFLCDRLLPEFLNPTFELSYNHMILFFAIDQALCTICLFRTPGGKTSAISSKRIVQSVVYGFLNCKSYYLVLFPLCLGLKVPIMPWLLDTYFGLSAYTYKIMMRYWEVLFYIVHHIGHIRHVYLDAHKFHHFLHDSTAFDAHVFGSGAPEEWLILIIDLIIAVQFGYLPPNFSFHVLGVSWLNKWSFHSRQADKSKWSSENFHADHHAHHNANLGIAYPYELLMKTVPKELKGKVILDDYVVRRVETENLITLHFEYTGINVK